MKETICKNCRFCQPGFRFMAAECLVDVEKRIDFVSGVERDFGAVFCSIKNKGECSDFEEMPTNGIISKYRKAKKFLRMARIYLNFRLGRRGG